MNGIYISYTELLVLSLMLLKSFPCEFNMEHTSFVKHESSILPFLPLSTSSFIALQFGIDDFIDVSRRAILGDEHSETPRVSL